MPEHSTILKTDSAMDGLKDNICVISKTNEEPPCITEHRVKMLENYLQQPLPDRVSHLWRYSDPHWFELHGKEISNELVDIQFTFNERYKANGLILVPLKDIFKLQEMREQVKNCCSGLIKDSSDKFHLLNEASWKSGYFLYVPKNLKVEEPISIYMNYSEKSKYEATKILVILEEGAEAVVIDNITSHLDSEILVNSLSEFYLADNSKLTYLNLQANGDKTVQNYSQRVELKKNAQLINLVVALGGKVSKADLGADLVGENASILTYGIVLGDKTQKFDHHTTINHKSPHTNSMLNFRVALKDKAMSAYTGNLKIMHDAVKCDAVQENRNLLLSPNAKAESIPELEILTNDVVRCNHGVTVGQVDKDQIFYLMSRGLSHKEAEKLVIEGFLEPTISRVPDEQLTEQIRQKIDSKLENL